LPLPSEGKKRRSGGPSVLADRGKKQKTTARRENTRGDSCGGRAALRSLSRPPHNSPGTPPPPRRPAQRPRPETDGAWCVVVGKSCARTGKPRATLSVLGLHSLEASVWGRKEAGRDKKKRALSHSSVLLASQGAFFFWFGRHAHPLPARPAPTFRPLFAGGQSPVASEWGGRRGGGRRGGKWCGEESALHNACEAAQPHTAAVRCAKTPARPPARSSKGSGGCLRARPCGVQSVGRGRSGGAGPAESPRDTARQMFRARANSCSRMPRARERFTRQHSRRPRAPPSPLRAPHMGGRGPQHAASRQRRLACGVRRPLSARVLFSFFWRLLFSHSLALSSQTNTNAALPPSSTQKTHTRSHHAYLRHRRHRRPGLRRLGRRVLQARRPPSGPGEFLFLREEFGRPAQSCPSSLVSLTRAL
jgi:hypothetical protein